MIHKQRPVESNCFVLVFESHVKGCNLYQRCSPFGHATIESPYSIFQSDLPEIIEEISAELLHFFPAVTAGISFIPRFGIACAFDFGVERNT